jgi:hypothetical protein
VRWKVYSHRVRVVTLAAKKTPLAYPSAQALSILSAYSAATGEPLLPALQHLHYTERLKVDKLICLTTFTPTSLEGLHIFAARSSCVFLKTALQHAVEDIPQLRELTLQTKLHVESLWLILSKLPALRKATITVPYSIDDVSSFCGLPALQEGKLSLLPSPHGEKISKGKSEGHSMECVIQGDPWSGGRMVQLSGDLLTLISAVPAAIHHGVTNLHLETTDTQPTGAWEELVDTISILSSSINQLFLQDNGGTHSISLGGLWKLLALENLHSLGLKVDCKVQPTEGGADQLFHHLCLSAKHKAVPLTKLQIHRLSGEHLGLASLQHVCDHLPHLVELEILLDSSLHYIGPLHLDDSPRSASTPGHPMKVLRFVDLRTEPFKPREYRLIALLINELFPKLEGLDVVGKAEEASLLEGWELINDMRRDYQRLTR